MLAKKGSRLYHEAMTEVRCPSAAIPTIIGFLGGVAVGGGLTYLLVKKLSLFGAPLPAGAETLGIALRQIRRYAFAASQDISPIVGITHASYALILLDTLEEIAGTEALNKTGIPVKKLRDFITKLQDKHAENLKRCDSHLQQVLAIERAEGMQIPGYVVAGAPRGA